MRHKSQFIFVHVNNVYILMRHKSHFIFDHVNNGSVGIFF